MVGPIQLLRAAADIQFIAKTWAICTGGDDACWCCYCQNWALQLMSHTWGNANAMVRRWMDTRMIENGINRQNGQCDVNVGPWRRNHGSVRGPSFNLLLFPQCICISSYLRVSSIEDDLAPTCILHHPSCIFKERCTRYSLQQEAQTESQCQQISTTLNRLITVGNTNSRRKR